MGIPRRDRVLLEVLSALIGSRGLRELDRRLGRELARHLGTDITALYLYSRDAHVFSPVSDCLLDPASPGYLIAQLPTAGTLKEAALAAGHALRCADPAAAPWSECRQAGAAGIALSSVAAAPLILRGEPGEAARAIGALMALTLAPRPPLDEEAGAFLDALAERLAPLLQRVMASEERDALAALASRVVVGRVTLDNLMPTIQDLLQQVIPHEMRGLVRFVADARGPWFEPIHIDGFHLDLEPLRQYPFERMAPAEMLATGRPVLITGYAQARFPEGPHFESLGILSAMLCPLSVQGRPYGFLALGSRRRNAFSERDLALAEQVGHHLSQAIANLQAYEEIRSLKDQLERENVYLREEIGAALDFKELVGESPSLRRTLRAIEQVAPTDSTVLITGETGTGKGLVAQAIHRLSPRRDRPFINVNCAALPPSLIESELFGHEKGAFTSAVSRKVGRFELADGGTIFLDEVGELPLDAQAKLLRVLESQEMERLGGTQTIRLNVRVLAATNRDLDRAVRAGTVRPDLFYRLKVFPIRVPPLRERPEDIPALARHFVRKYAARHRKTITRIATGALRALTAYGWPGNVRELEHLIERAVILAQGPEIGLDALEGELVQPGAGPDRAGKAGHTTLAEVERAHILEVLAQTNWVVAGRHGAAARLGLKRSTLQHRMKKLGIARRG